MEQAIMIPLDHHRIDDQAFFKSRASTAENISIFIWNQLLHVMPSDAEKKLLYQVQLFETDTISVIYKGENR